MTVYLLDTHIASDCIKGQPPEVRDRLTALPLHEVRISSVTLGELSYALAKRGKPAALLSGKLQIQDWSLSGIRLTGNVLQ